MGVSGGPDSIALTILAAAWAQAGGKRRPVVRCVVVDHATRPESSAEAAAVAADVAHNLGLQTDVMRLTGGPPRSDCGAKEFNSGRAHAELRAGRMAALATAAFAMNADAVLLGHHMDDQIETAAMRLFRGSGLYGLAAMRPARPLDFVGADTDCMLVRPLLAFPKARLHATCRAHSTGCDAFVRVSASECE